MENKILSNSAFSLFNKALGKNCTINKKIKHVPPVDDIQEKIDIYNDEISLLAETIKLRRNSTLHEKNKPFDSIPFNIWRKLKQNEKNAILKAYLQKIDRYDAESIFYSHSGDLLLLDIAFKNLDNSLTPSKIGDWVYNKLFDPEIIGIIANDIKNKMESQKIHKKTDIDELVEDDNKDRKRSIDNWG